MNTSLVTWCAGPAGDGACVIAVGTSRTCLADGAPCGTNGGKTLLEPWHGKNAYALNKHKLLSLAVKPR